MLVYQDIYIDKHFCFVINKKTENNNQLISILEVDFDMNSVYINKIVSIHGKKELLKHIQSSIDNGLKVYTNKRTGD